MDPSILVLASASVPFGVLAAADLFSDKRTKGFFGVASSAWSGSGVVLVYFGVPGLLFFPGLLAILILSSLVQYREGRGRSQMVKALLLSVLLGAVTLGLVFL